MMSEHQPSVSENYSQELSNQEKSVIKVKWEQQLVDLNVLLHKNWKRFGGLRRSKMMARLDPLPWVEGKLDQWQFVIGGLLSMILLHPPKGSFFLHIECDQCNLSNNSKLSKGFNHFQIHFKTNIKVSEYWHQLYDGKLEEISVVVNKLKGAFSYDCCLQNGYLFSIVLPGKQDL